MGRQDGGKEARKGSKRRKVKKGWMEVRIANLRTALDGFLKVNVGVSLASTEKVFNSIANLTLHCVNLLYSQGMDKEDIDRIKGIAKDVGTSKVVGTEQLLVGLEVSSIVVKNADITFYMLLGKTCTALSELQIDLYIEDFIARNTMDLTMNKLLPKSTTKKKKKKQSGP